MHMVFLFRVTDMLRLKAADESAQPVLELTV